MMFKAIAQVFLFASLVFVFGCSSKQNKHPEYAEYNAHNHPSYMLRGHNRTFAVYNGEHRLISHPIEDLLANMKWRKLANQPPITDIYVVSHGWNYTMPVAIANYHNYMQMVDEFVEKIKAEKAEKCAEATKDREATKVADCSAEQCKPEQNKQTPESASAESTDHALKPETANNQQVNNNLPCFQPYIIFITWISTVRPLTDIANAVLPFGLDRAIRPITTTIDKVPVHLVTAWKESLNAEQNALGVRFPDDYLKEDWRESKYGYLDSNILEDSDGFMGEDVPVSALIYRLIQQKYYYNDQANHHCEKFDIDNPASDNCVPLNHAKIHLVGHSYDAKLVSLAGMEALRRWVLDKVAIRQNHISREWIRHLLSLPYTKTSTSEFDKIKNGVVV